MVTAPVLSLTHGGGPLPLMGDPQHEDIIKSLKTKVPSILKLGTPQAPRAIVLVTAHWSQQNPSISNGTRHDLLFDYYGFPKETYQYKYPAPGSPEVATEVAAALKEEGLNPELDGKRGWDHGVFVPMMLVAPSADVPIVQLSVLQSEDPASHMAMGRALGRLRERNIAIVGSGYASMHNLRAMFDGTMQSPSFGPRNKAWSKALGEALAAEDPAERETRLAQWRAFPHAYEMHPKNGGEHFMPLLVCAGAGGRGPVKSFADNVNGIKVWSYYWE